MRFAAPHSFTFQEETAPQQQKRGASYFVVKIAWVTDLNGNAHSCWKFRDSYVLGAELGLKISKGNSSVFQGCKLRPEELSDLAKIAQLAWPS